jgi:hypothetical protein
VKRAGDYPSNYSPYSNHPLLRKTFLDILGKPPTNGCPSTFGDKIDMPLLLLGNFAHVLIPPIQSMRMQTDDIDKKIHTRIISRQIPASRVELYRTDLASPRKTTLVIGKVPAYLEVYGDASWTKRYRSRSINPLA